MDRIDEEVAELAPAWGTPEYEAARRGTDPLGADFTSLRGHKPWPDPKKMKFNLERDEHDPHNPSNRCAPLRRRYTDQ